MPAHIESLPPELLHSIFLLSDCNPSLAASSPYIAAKLSDNYVYREACTYHLVERRHTQSGAQSRIFAAKWMTWTFFKSFITKTYESKGCLCGKTPDTGCFDAIWPPHFDDATTMVFSRSHLPALSFVKCRIPTKLLHGPWTQDKIQFLRFLLWTTSMTVDWADRDTRKLALDGKKEAILEGNLEAVELFNHNRRLGKAPGLEQVRLAVIEAGCNRSIVYDIMSTARTWGLRGDGWNCDVLDKWCKDHIAAGDPKGKWLRLKLQELRVVHGSRKSIQPTAEAGAETIGTGFIHPKTGDYDDVEDDKLVIMPHRWNQAVNGNGWLFGERLGGGDDIFMLHGLDYVELFFHASTLDNGGDTRDYTYTRRDIKGFDDQGQERYIVFTVVPVSGTRTMPADSSASSPSS